VFGLSEFIPKGIFNSFITVCGVAAVYVIFKMFDSFVSRWAEKDNPLFSIFKKNRKQKEEAIDALERRTRRADDPFFFNKLIEQYDKSRLHYDKIADEIREMTQKLTHAIEIMAESNRMSVETNKLSEETNRVLFSHIQGNAARDRLIIKDIRSIKKRVGAHVDNDQEDTDR
jgi:hypothetical protein